MHILRRELDQTEQTGTTLYVDEEGRYVQESAGSTSRNDVPEIIADRIKRLERVEQRRCDKAAQKVGLLVIGLPDYHPLLKDSEQWLADLRQQLDKMLPRLRAATAQEREQHDRHWTPAFISDEPNGDREE